MRGLWSISVQGLNFVCQFMRDNVKKVVSASLGDRVVFGL